jgi:hypothetical protein
MGRAAACFVTRVAAVPDLVSSSSGDRLRNTRMRDAMRSRRGPLIWNVTANPPSTASPAVASSRPISSM